jgi:hypothetical protein
MLSKSSNFGEHPFYELRLISLLGACLAAIFIGNSSASVRLALEDQRR